MLITAHARAGRVADARALFDEMPTRNVVLWSPMVNGHASGREIRHPMREKGVDKTPGCSTLEIKGVIHLLIVGDLSHPCIKDILTRWDEIDSKIRLDEGYIPDKKEVLLDIEEGRCTQSP